MKGMKGAYKLLLIPIILVLALVAFPFASLPAAEADTENVVRVGWYESPFNITDNSGRRSGYAYEYQQKLAAYTGWKYEYVTGSWPDLLEMLEEGKIDLLSDVSYSEERTEHMYYSSLPMGAEDYYVFIAASNNEITKSDYTTFNGKKVGINKGSIIVDLFRNWEERNGVEAEILEMSEETDVAYRMLLNGNIDMYVTVDSFFDPVQCNPIVKIGSSDFYFVVSKSRPELVNPLNEAIERIQTETPYYNQQLHEKYLNDSGVNYHLSTEEKAWLTEHKKIRVGYQDNYLAFCAKDPKTGELTGALKTYLSLAADSLANTHLDFEAIGYPTAAAAIEALKKGEVDCMFPSNLTDYDGEAQGLFITAPIMRTDMSAIIREADQKSFVQKSRVTVAVNAGNPNYDMFLADHFPDWRPIYFATTAECLDAIADRKADCLLMSNYRYNNISKQCQELGLMSITTGVEMDYCFAVDRNNTVLYSIINKVADLVPAASVNAALTYYFTEDAKMGFGEMLQQRIWIIVAVAAAVIVAILLLVLYNVRANRKAKSIQTLVDATETDDLTGLYNRDYFLEYAGRIARDDPEKAMDALALDIEQFHMINALYGRELGDHILCCLGEEIQKFLEKNGGIACHTDADRFLLYVSHFEDRNAFFDRLQGSVDRTFPNVNVRLRMGVMPWAEGVDPQQAIEHALVACSRARGNYRERIIVVDEALREKESLEQHLLSDVHRAVEKREFEVYYQPKYDIRGEKPVLVGAEALTRWRHPERGMIPPADFIPLFERNGLIGMVDQTIRDIAVGQIAAWKEKYGVVFPISINLARMEVMDPALGDSLDALIEKYGLTRDALRLEVTETAYIENDDRVVEVIKDLRSSGYKVDMDDFGSGYSSLNMLSVMPIDLLKMDRAFIRDIENNDKSNRLVKLILEIAKTLKVDVIAEGVETQAQIDILRDLGCEMVQGYFFAPPLPADEFERKILAPAIAK